MASFQIAIKPNRLAAGRFVNRVRRKLQEALVQDQKRTGITQSKIAAAIGVHRSVISRELNGRQDITLGRVAELAWAMGREVEFGLKIPEAAAGQNALEIAAAVQNSSPAHFSNFEVTKAESFHVKPISQWSFQQLPDNPISRLVVS